jgi:hypothetical protein
MHRRSLPTIARWLRIVLHAHCALAIASCATIRPPPASAPGAAARSQDLYVIRRGWHVDVGLPAAALPASLHAIGEQLPGAEYLLFGFGDRRYLLTHVHGSGGELAALWPGPALILVTGLRASPAAAVGERNAIRIKVTFAQLGAAQQYLARSFSDDSEHLRAVASGPYRGSVFFAARHRYSGLFTCNTWAARLLVAAGVPIDAAGVVLAGQLWSQVLPLSAVADTRP